MNTKLIEYLNKKGFTAEQLYTFKAVIVSDGKIYHGESQDLYHWLNTEIIEDADGIKYTALDVVRNKANRYNNEGCSAAIFVPLFTLDGTFTGLSIRKMHDEMKHDSWFVPGKRKIDLLYNLNNAFEYAVKKNSVIITEGVYDAIALANYGFKNAVALLGTNMSYLQYFQLLSIVDNVALCLDNDAAGISAMEKIVKAWPNSMKYYRVNIDKDPDEFLKEHGAAEFKKRITRWQIQ